MTPPNLDNVPETELTGEALLDATVATACSLQGRVRGLYGRPALTRGRMAVLRQLVRAGAPRRVSTLAKALGCTMSNITQIVGRLLSQGFVDLITYENKPTWRAVAINAEGRVALGQADAEAAVRAEESFEAISPEERVLLEAMLRRLRRPKERQVDPGEPRVIVAGSAVRPRPMNVEKEEVAKRTPPDPQEEARERRAELIARARAKDPAKLPPWERLIWDFESRGIPAPEHYYEDAELFKEFAADYDADARSPPESRQDGRSANEPHHDSNQPVTRHECAVVSDSLGIGDTKGERDVVDGPAHNGP